MFVSRLVSVLVGMSAFGGAASAQVESTGFETSDGWVAGYSICGPEFAATCSYPVTNVCVAGDHVASQNCCEADPNEDTGWFMADDSRHCNQPHIDTVNPFSGLQHLRFQNDAAAGYQRVTALTPRLTAQAPQHAVVSFEVAGSDLRFEINAEDDPFGPLAALVLFSFGGYIGIYDYCDSDFFVGVLPPLDSAYHNFTIDLDPAANTIRYCFGGNTVLLTKFGPNQARTVQGATFRTGTIVDVDDFAVTRGASAPVTCREFPSECQTPCGPRPCVSLKAVAVNGEPIAPTTDVHVRPGDRIETEIRFSGWGGNIPQLRLYQARLLLRDAAKSGTSGSVLPLGWDAPLVPIGCYSGANCPPAYPMCNAPPGVFGLCHGPNHDPESGAFITTERPDFALFELAGYFFVKVATINYLFVGLGEEPFGNEDSGVPRYAGTVVMQVSNDACGTFTIQFNDDKFEFETFLGDPHYPPLVINPVSHPLVIHVCADDGTLCDGVESCDGACCDQWIDDCQDAVAQADCSCPNCVWTGGVECADIECKAEFVVIPTVSQWGLVVLTLLLLTCGKVMFGRKSTLSAS